MPRDNTSLAALDMSDHVPFYPTLRREGLNFHDTFLGIILAEDRYTGFNRRLGNFNRLGFRDHYQTNSLWITVAFICGSCNLFKGMEITFTNGCDKVRHVVIIIVPFLI